MYDLAKAHTAFLNFGNVYCERILFAVLSGLFGLILGKIVVHKKFNDLLCRLHIYRTANQNIWDDVIEPFTWVRVFMKDGTSYLGQYKYGEPFKSEPIIVLATYQKLDKDSDVVIDNSGKPDELIMLNTKDFDRIEITHSLDKGF